MAQIDAGQLSLGGKEGFIQQLIKSSLERGLQAELSGHLGYDKGDPIGRFLPNSRNGRTRRRWAPRPEMWTWLSRGTGTARSPRIWFPRAPRRTGGLEDMIISLYAGGMTIRDIAHHLAFTLGTELSHETISKITDEVLDEVIKRQKRPLDPRRFLVNVENRVCVYIRCPNRCMASRGERSLAILKRSSSITTDSKSVPAFKHRPSEYIDRYNQERIKENLQGLRPMQYRPQSLQVA